MKTEKSDEVKEKVKKEDTVDTIPTGSGAAKPKIVPEVEEVKSAMKEYCLVWDALFSYLDDKYELGTGSFLSKKVNLVLADQPYTTRSVRIQLSSAHDVFSKRNKGDVVRLMGSVRASGTHGHLFCLHVHFYYWNSTLRTAKNEGEKVGRI